MTNQCRLDTKSQLYIAIDECDIEGLMCLLENNAFLKEEEPTLIARAVQRQSRTIVNLLIDHGFNVNATDEFGRTALFYCFQRLYIIYRRYPTEEFCRNRFIDTNEMIESLLEQGADPNVSKYIYFPLHTAVIHEDSDIVNLLLKYNADINCQDTEGNTSLHYAALIDYNADILVNLLAYNPDIDIRNCDNRTPVHLASIAHNSTVLEILLSNKFNINCVDFNGDTPLHCVCRNTVKLTTVKMLLEHNADVNARNFLGNTPLHELALITDGNEEDIIEVIKELCKWGADINPINNAGMTPLICTYDSMYQYDIFEALLRCGADVHYKYKHGKTLLHLVAEDLSAENFKNVLLYGADINSFCEKNKTALDYFKININAAEKTGWIHGIYDPRKFIGMFKCAREHIIKLKCAGLNVNSRNIDFIYNNNTIINSINKSKGHYIFEDKLSVGDIVQIENKCNAEISKLKKREFDGIVLINFLNKNLHHIIKFVKNKEFFSNMFMHDDFKKKFPLYANIIKNRFNQAIKISEIVGVVAKYFDCLEIINKLPLVCRQKILRYLDLNDLKVLLKAAQPNTITL